MSYLAIAFPFMIYLASWGTCLIFRKPTAVLIVGDYHAATGIVFIYAQALEFNSQTYWGDVYYSIALSLNVLLTLMIITRLFLHRKNIRRALGDQGGAGRLYEEIITMFVESGALFAASFALLFGPWATGSILIPALVPILYEVQVRTALPLP